MIENALERTYWTTFWFTIFEYCRASISDRTIYTIVIIDEKLFFFWKNINILTIFSIKITYIIKFLISINLFLYINLPLNSYSSYEAGGGTAYANAGATGWLALDHELPLLCFVIGLESDLSSSLEFNFPPTLNCLYMFSLKSLPYHWIS